jgi:4-hydroxybenzoate polyprenyltransferase
MQTIPAVQNFVALTRLDKPVGIWLLFWPCAWGLALGAIWSKPPLADVIYYLALCFIGSVLMRSVGCIYNDWRDRDIDARVERTKNRPLAAGTISPRWALLYGVILLLLAFAVWWLLPVAAQIMALASLLLVFLYPLMKRMTHWPQVFLGLTFNWGIWVGAVALWPHFRPEMAVLYLAAVLWTIGYDSIYAIQDYAQDVQIGVKSTAVRLGPQIVGLVWICYLWQTALLIWLGVLADLAVAYYLGIVVMAGLLLRQCWQVRIDRADMAGGIFRSNIWVGGVIFLALLAGRGV